MKRPNSLFVYAGTAMALLLSASHVTAQPQRMGAMDPQQFQQQIQQRMMEFVREQLVVTNDDEWKVIEARLSKVTQLRTETTLSGLGMFSGMMRMGGNRGGDQAGGQRRLQAFGGQPSPESEALQRALDANAPAAEIQAKLAKVREARRQKAAALAKAQDDLRQVLSVRQEATLVNLGVLE